MALPTAVKKQGEESDNAMKLAMKQAEERKKAEEEKKGGDPATAAAAEKESGKQPITQSNENGQANDDPGGYKKAAEDWKNRFTSYKASTDNTIHGLREEIKAMNEKIETMNAEREALEAQATIEPLNAKDVLSESERDDYSEEFVDMVGKVSVANAKHLLDNQSKVIASLQKQVEELSGTVKQSNEAIAKTETERFYDDLDEAVPAWESLQKDARFNVYMSEPDPLSGFERGQLLQKSLEDNDVKRAILLYTSFAKEHGLPLANPTSSVNPLEVVPDDAGAGHGGGNDVDEAIYSQEKIDNFYQQWATNKKSLNMTDEELTAQDKLYSAAILEGRVR